MFQLIPGTFAEDKIELITGILTILGLLVAIIGVFQTASSVRQASELANSDRKAALTQAKKDLRWRQTVEAQGAVRRMLDDVQAFEAMAMSDVQDRNFIINGQLINITFSAVQEALNPELSKFSDLQLFIRDRFDTLLSHLELMLQGVDAKIFLLKDLRFPIDYYVDRIDSNIGLSLLKNYIKVFGFPKSEKFIDSIVALKPSKEEDSAEDCAVEAIP